MSAAKLSGKSTKKSKKKGAEAPADSRIDLNFGGPMLFVPAVSQGAITSVEVYSPRNGHPVGAVFLPGVFFTDAELDSPESDKWPEAASFSLLDPHSYAIHFTHTAPQPAFPVTSIPEANHKVKPGRKISSDWDVAIQVNGQLSGWTTNRPFAVTKGLYYGSDAPASATVAGVQRLTFSAVSGMELCGAGPEATEYLKANAAKGGTLIIEGEIAYQSSLLHERQAIDAIAKLAGLDFHLTAMAPIARRTALMSHIMPCLNSVIVA